MHTLTAIPISDIVLAAPRYPIQPGLPDAYKPKNWVEEWKKPGKQMTWTEFHKTLPPEYQEEARQDWQESRSQAATRPKEPVADPATATPEAAEQPLILPSQVADDETRQQTFDYGQPVNPQQFLAKLKEGVTSFADFLNTSMIRPYNKAIQHALQAITKLSQEPTVSADMERDGEKLLEMLAYIQADGAKDLQKVQQLGQLAYQLGQASGEAVSNMQTRGPQPAPQTSFWDRMNPFSRSRAASTLTAEAGSAARLLQ